MKRPLKCLRKKTKDILIYKRACNLILEAGLQTPTIYDSSYEALASIILIHSGYHAKNQVAVAGYKADIYLEKQKDNS